MEILEREIYWKYKQIVEAQGISFDKARNQQTHVVTLSEIIGRYDVFCFDGYGTLYNRGHFCYPRALEWFSLLREAGKSLRLVTNAASNTEDVLAAEAASRGFCFTAEETVSSGGLLSAFAKKSGIFELYYIGRPTGLRVLELCGIKAVENPCMPVVAVSSSTATPEIFRQAIEILKRPGGLLLVLNPDAWAPKIDGTREPVSGALCERLLRECSCQVRYFGKPFPEMWNAVKKTLPEKSRVVMIGDTLGTDILGAYIAGFDSALVVGRNMPAAELAEDEKFLGVRPTYYLLP